MEGNMYVIKDELANTIYDYSINKRYIDKEFIEKFLKKLIDKFDIYSSDIISVVGDFEKKNLNHNIEITNEISFNTGASAPGYENET